MITINGKILENVYTSAEWALSNPVLSARVAGYDSDELKFKLGDGVNHWADLPWYGGTALKELNLTQSDIGSSYGGALTYDSGASTLSLNWTTEVQAVLGTNLPKTMNLWLYDGTYFVQYMQSSYATMTGANITALTWFGVTYSGSFYLQIAST